MDDLSRFSFLNSDYPDHSKRVVGNLSVTSRYGPDKARRMLRCRTCKVRFSERKGTVLIGPGSPTSRSKPSWSTSPRGVACADQPAL